MSGMLNSIVKGVKHSKGVCQAYGFTRRLIHKYFSPRVPAFLDNVFAPNYHEGCRATLIPMLNDRLYLGDIYDAHDVDFLKKHNVTHIVTAIIGVPPSFPDQFKYLHLDLMDNTVEEILESFNLSNVFIDKFMRTRPKDEKILIHCIRGMSRSTSLVISYLIYKHHMSYEEAYKLVKEARPIIRPNYGFIEQLKIFEKRVKEEEKDSLEDENENI